MKALRKYDTAAHEVQESVPKSVGKDKVKVWVEGNDWRLYGRFFVKDLVDREGRKGGHSCHSAVDSYREFKKQFPKKPAIVIRDADFKRANGENLEAEDDIFYADCHDHEMMCVFQEKVREALMSNFEYDGHTDTFFNSVFDELKFLSYLKWYNYNNDCRYNFKTLGSLFGMDESEFKDIGLLEEDVYNRTDNNSKKRIDLHDLAGFMSDHNDVNTYDLTNGHDFYNRINYHLKKINKANTRSEEQLKDSVYIAFAFFFRNTNLYKRLNNWCINNNRFILKAV